MAHKLWRLTIPWFKTYSIFHYPNLLYDPAVFFKKYVPMNIENTNISYQKEFISKYGAVYTPGKLADFVGHLLIAYAKKCKIDVSFIIDPACGEGALLNAISVYSPNAKLIGIDIDKSVINFMSGYAYAEIADFICPKDSNTQYSANYWLAKLPPIDAIIANPPWSSERLYVKHILQEKGFSLVNGQYDSYELFIELGISILREGGLFAFIIPDSLFAPEKVNLRKYLLENTELKVVARLGEKLFPGVFRAASVIIGRKAKPTTSSRTCCYRLDTIARDSFLNGKLDLYDHFLKNNHYVIQKRFCNNPLFNIDVDTKSEDSSIINCISKGNLTLGDLFVFGRGVEISKNGLVVICKNCKSSQGIRHFQDNSVFICKSCHEQQYINSNVVKFIVEKKQAIGYSQMWVGESIGRYTLTMPRFIKMDVSGIDYKSPDLFNAPKLLVRKTGLGIYAAIDLSNALTSQTVYILKPKSKLSMEALYFYLAFVNSRIIYYYYQKMYGATEWKSHPYLTKKIIFSLPVPLYKNVQSDNEIANLSMILSQKYERNLDLKLEYLIATRYDLKNAQLETIKSQMEKLPPLSSILNMSF